MLLSGERPRGINLAALFLSLRSKPPAISALAAVNSATITPQLGDWCASLLPREKFLSFLSISSHWRDL